MDKSLLRLYRRCHSSHSWREMAEVWQGEHPGLRTSGGALYARYRRIKRAGHSEPSPEPTEGGGDDPLGTGAPQTVGSDTSPVSHPNRGPSRPADGDGSGETNELEEPDDLREEFRKVLAEVEKGNVGNLASRKRPSCQGIRVEEDLLADVDDLINEFYHNEADDWMSLWRLNCLVYAGAVVVERRARKSLARPGGLKNAKVRAIETKSAEITELRRKIGWLTSEISRRRLNQRLTNRQRANLVRLQRLYGFRNLRQLRVKLEELKACLRVRCLQRRRLKLALRRRAANERYRLKGPKSLEEGATPSNAPTPPTADQISEYWNGVVGVPGTCDLEDPAIAKWQEEQGDLPEPTWEEPELAVWKSAVRKSKSWKAPGHDGIYAFWWKNFHQANAHLWEAVKGVLEGVVEPPDWFVRGRTVLIPKKECQGKPDQYRPITCLNTGYKLLTAVITILLRQHVVEHAILPAEQKALHSGRRGCLEALLIDSTIVHEARTDKRNLSVAWIDYSKAYDRVPHDWILEMLDTIKAPEPLRRCVAALIPKWQSEFKCGMGRAAVRTDLVFKRGLFQGDSLSPLLFCLCIAPLSSALRATSGFKSRVLGSSISHTLFMDDLKVYGGCKSSLRYMLTLIDRVSKAVGMQLGLSKCAVAHLVAGRTTVGGEVMLPDRRKILAARRGNPYKYLGIEQIFESDSATVKERLRKLYLQRLRKIWFSDLNGKHKVRATNAWAVSIFRYYFGVLIWRRHELMELDRATRAVLRASKSHQSGSSVNRLYLPRSDGGRGLLRLELVWEGEVVSTAAYLCASEDPQLQSVIRHMATHWLYRGWTVLKEANTILREYDVQYVLDEEGITNQWGDRDVPSRVTADLQRAQKEALQRILSSKVIHGVFYQQCREEAWDRRGSHAWLKDGRLRSQTEGLIVAMQDGVLHTRAYQVRILKKTISPTCRVCKLRDETIGHLLSSCEPQKWVAYKARHDRVLYQLVLGLASKFKLTLPESLKWGCEGWSGVGVIENSQMKLVIDISLPTDEEFTARRPDLIAYAKCEQRAIIFEVAVAWEPLIPEREDEKRGKYEALARDLKNQLPGWKTEVRPLVVGDLGSMAGFRKELDECALFVKSEIDFIARNCQFEALCCSVRIIRQVLSKD